METDAGGPSRANSAPQLFLLVFGRCGGIGGGDRTAAVHGPADVAVCGCGRMGAYLGGWDGSFAPDASARGPITQPCHHSLCNNRIGAKGASALAAALLRCTALQTVKYVGVGAWVRVWEMGWRHWA